MKRRPLPPIGPGDSNVEGRTLQGLRLKAFARFARRGQVDRIRADDLRETSGKRLDGIRILLHSEDPGAGWPARCLAASEQDRLTGKGWRDEASNGETLKLEPDDRIALLLDCLPLQLSGAFSRCASLAVEGRTDRLEGPLLASVRMRTSSARSGPKRSTNRAAQWPTAVFAAAPSLTRTQSATTTSSDVPYRTRARYADATPECLPRSSCQRAFTSCSASPDSSHTK